MPEYALRCNSAVDCDWQSDWYPASDMVIREEGENGLLTCPDCKRHSFKTVTRTGVTV